MEQIETPQDRVEALLQEQLDDGSVRCNVCQRRCVVPAGRRGWCMTRLNSKGRLYSLTYGKVSSASINPIEKKPVYHFLPGSTWFSVGSLGCNFRCPGCQTFEIAHMAGFVSTYHLAPRDLVGFAENQGCSGISWTFNEPTLWFEYTLDGARIAKKRGLCTNYVTNGYITEEALSLIAPHLDVYRVDVKAFSEEGYRKVANVLDFQGILRITEKARSMGLHVEVVTNLIPGLNDDDGQLAGIASWIAERLGEDTPWHVTRFHPQYKLSHLEPTPASSVDRALAAGQGAGLRYVYVGNDPGHPRQSTYCASCGVLLIERYVMEINQNRIVNGACPDCGEAVPGRFTTDG